MKYEITYSKDYKKSLKKIKCRQTIEILEMVIDMLAKDEKLPEKYRDHKLKEF